MTVNRCDSYYIIDSGIEVEMEPNSALYLRGIYMDSPNKKTAKIEQLLNDDWQNRSPEERRSDIDKRHSRDKSYFHDGGSERREITERRHPEERRDGWLRVGQWRSISVFDNKDK